MSNEIKLFGNKRAGGARLAKRKKPQKQKKPLKVLAIWLTVILLLEGAYFFAVYTDNSFVSYWRTVYINTAISTMRHQWLATALLPKSVVQAVVDRNTQAAASIDISTGSTWGKTDADANPVPELPDSTLPSTTPELEMPDDGTQEIEVEVTRPKELTEEELAALEREAFYELYWELDQATMEAWIAEHPETLDNGWSGIYINEAGLDDKGTSIYTTMGEQVLAVDVPNKLLLVRVSGSGYRGVLAIGKDASRFCIGTSSTISQGDDPFEYGCGETVGTIAQNVDGGILAIPANGFIDVDQMGNAGAGNGGRLSGYCMAQGVEYNVNYHAKNTSWHKFVRMEFHEDNLMYIKNVDDPVSENCTDALEFEPPMIIDGEILVTDWWTEINPRACVGQTDRYEILMMMIEGRGASGSLGTDINVCAQIFAKHGCMQAINVDGGTSGMMWYNGEYITRCSNANTPEGRTIPNACVYRAKGE